ncbi:MAG: right-handed parallel beta-helix repeat-containing protein [Candidatus Bathyarchaeota archaeon]|nr:MAG: right-handed parallel beta-helix repeat-containing protein [Candidatus Bathyarchaeota archaeon]
MKKGIWVYLLFFFLLSSKLLLTLSYDVQQVSAEIRTWTVDDDGPADYHTIQGAVDAAEEGDTIFVYNGTYYETVFVEKTLSLIGEHKSGTIIDGDRTGTVVHASNTSVVIAAFTIRNSNDYPYTGISLKDSRNSNVTENIIFNCTEGIRIYNSTDTIIEHNTITANYGGIHLAGNSRINTITHNVINSNSWGIYLDNSSDNLLTENILTNNSWTGIDLFQSKCENNILSGNIIASNGNGIRSYNRASGNSMQDNVIMYNNDTEGGKGNGISLSGHSRSHIITGNTLTENRYGLHLFISEDNTLYHNNFINNTKHAYQAAGSHSNSWDNGFEGNYWSNYTGVDSDHDGIGDSLYEIAENNTDFYPLMGTFSHFNADSEYPIQTICNSTITDYVFNGSAISFDVTGKNGTVGFCRIRIPTALLNDTYRVFVNGTEVPYTLLLPSNSTHIYLHFNYLHSTQEVTIIPEFPSFLILALSITATLLAASLYETTKMSNNTKQTLTHRSISSYARAEKSPFQSYMQAMHGPHKRH